MLTSIRRGLLLGYGAMAFGDASNNVDEVISPRFFCIYMKGNNNNLKIQTI